MTVNEFINYYNFGHGKAVTLLRNEPDKKPFQKPFIELIKKKYWHGHHRYINEIMHIITDNEFCIELKTLFGDLIKSGENINCYVHLDSLGYCEDARKCLESVYEGDLIKCGENIDCYLHLDSLGYCEDARKCLESVYEENYKLLKEMLVSGNYTREQYCSVFSKYHMSCVALGNYRWSYTNLPKLIKDNADLYLLVDEVEGWSPIDKIHREEFESNNSSEWFKQIFDEALKEHKAYERVKAVLFPDVPEQKPIEYKTVGDFYNDYEKASYVDIKSSFSKASPKVVNKLAELALKETDLSKKRRLLYLFLKENNDFGVIPDFPLPPEPLIEIAKEYLNNPSDDIRNSYDDTDAVIHYAIHILSEMKNVKAREFCLSLFAKEEAEKYIREIVIGTLNENYTPDDEKLLRDTYNTDFKDSVIYILENLSEKGIKDAPYDLLFDAYETTAMPARHSTVLALINLGLITNEMLNECEYDVYPKIAEAAKKEKNKRFIKKFNNPNNEGWNEIKSQEDIDFLLNHTCAFHDFQLRNFEYNPKSSKYAPLPVILRFDSFFYDDAVGTDVGLELLCEEVEHFNFYVGADIIAMFFCATFKFYENSILWGADPGPAQEKNKYGFSDEEVWIKCKKINWRLCERFETENYEI